MITCNSCGKPNPAEMNNCQYCGAALVSQSGSNLKMNAQEQIPAWLESLKAIERPAPPANGQPGFSVADFVDPNALPGWMRPDSAFHNGDSGKHPAMRPAWMSGPNTDSSSAGNISPGSLSANSLIDSSSLPTWMRSQQAGQPGQGGPPDMISANSLVEPNSLPGWLTAQPSLPPQPQRPSQAGQPSPIYQPQVLASPPSAPPYPAQTGAAGQSTWQGPPNAAQGISGPTGSGISASSLLDMNTLPPWLREENQPGQQQPGGMGAGSGSPALSAGSLIDTNALPDWLRNAEPGQQGSNNPPASSSVFGGSGVYGGPGTPSRVENMRVPSRPRAEMAPLEQSEMAASVFSSMLGVASTSASYSGGEYPAQQPFQSMPQMPQLSPSPQAPGANQQFPAPATSPFTQPGQPGGMPPASPTQGNVYGGAYQPAMQQAGYARQDPQNAYGMPPGLAANSPVPASPFAPRGQMGTMMGEQGGQAGGTAGTKTAKRGFLETIRGWFHS